VILGSLEFSRVLVCKAAVLLGSVVLIAALVGNPAAAAPAPVDVLVIHDSLPGKIPAGIVDGNTVIDLLGHFNLKGRLMSLEEYKPGELNRYRFIFVLGVDDRKVTYPTQLLADLQATSLPVFWVCKHADELFSAPGMPQKLGFRVLPQSLQTGFTSVLYKNKRMLKGDQFLYTVELLDPSRVQVLATAESASGSKPYLLRSGAFWYCADSPFAFNTEGDRYLVFCDVLHDFFGIPHEEERRALIRLEDISAESDLGELRRAADLLYSRHIPFQISLIPIYRNPGDKENAQDVYLSDRPEFVRAIRYMVSKGGVVVMHGVTHQYRGKSTDDYEFWDEQSQSVVSGDSRTSVEQKLRLGLAECFKNGIYPVTWETPHYVASRVDYETFARVFNSAYDRVLSTDNPESGHFFPYTSVDRFGRFIIPESLGYINEEKPDPALMIADAERLQVVRDGVASFFFHPFLSLTYLEQLLDGIQGLGYQFASIRDYDCRVQMDEMLVQTYTETVRLQLHEHYLHRFLQQPDGRTSGESYSNRRLNTLVRDPGVVPPDSILVMEGVAELVTQKEVPRSGFWESTWNGAWTWAKSKWQQTPAESGVPLQPRVIVLWDPILEKTARNEWNNQKSYLGAFETFGFRAEVRAYQDFSREALDPGVILVVPRWAQGKLSSRQVGYIVDFVKGGGRIVLDGPGPLGLALGVQTEKRTIRVKTVEDLHYGNDHFQTRECTWNPPADVARFQIKNPISTLAQDKDSELPMAVLAGYGQGRFLYLAARFDPTTELGYTRYPYFVHYIRDGFDARLPLQRPQLELYFDPTGSEAIERLAADWRRLGVRALYVAAFKFMPKWSYDYQRFIDICHKNGILVYAWFELPHVSVTFWEEHPEWRAKTATGEEAGNGVVGWRDHMDLDIPECQDAAFDFVEELLQKYRWDGVNIAELNYDTNGPEDPKRYLPMGPSTRSAFKALGGFDPIQLLDPGSEFYWRENPRALRKFEMFRNQRVLAWHRALLERVTPLAQARDMEVIVTMLDSLHSRTVSRDTGVDSHLILSLMDQFPFTLQVEDPAHLWAESPNRYLRFADTYLGLVRDRGRLMFDINVVARQLEQSHSPTHAAAGIELAESLSSASAASGRAAIYSTGTVPFEDLQILARVLAHEARVDQRWNSWVTQSDRSVVLNAPGRWQSFRVDDELWPGWGENEVYLPAGAHRITAVERPWFHFFDTSVLDLRLLRFTGNLDSLAPTKRGLEFTYDSYLRSLALFNRAPFEVRVDGRLVNEPTDSLGDIWSVRLPRGRHRVEIVADSAAETILDTTSLYGSSLIVIFGTVSCGVMVLLYMSILAKRALARAVRGRGSETSPAAKA
jgi:uncharacterized protein YdaL